MARVVKEIVMLLKVGLKYKMKAEGIMIVNARIPLLLSAINRLIIADVRNIKYIGICVLLLVLALILVIRIAMVIARNTPYSI